MHRAEILYAPPRKPRKRKVPPPLQPLVPKKVALRWHAEATAAFCDADLFLRWQETTHDERLEQLQSTIELIYGKSAAKYTALAPLAPEDRVLLCPKSRYVPERNVHTALQRLAKAEPLRVEATTTTLVTRMRPALLSVEMRARLEAHLTQRMRGSIWQDEVRSLLARPLDATVFVHRAEQMQHPTTSLSLATAVTLPIPVHVSTGPPELLFPYSTDAHAASSKVALMYRCVCFRRSLRTHLDRLFSSLLLLQHFCRFRLRRHRQARVRVATANRSARVIQSCASTWLAIKNKAATAIQCCWRRHCLRQRRRYKQSRHRAATKIKKLIKRYSTYKVQRAKCLLRIYAACRRWCYRHRAIRREASRLASEIAAMEAAQREARTTTLTLLQTPAGRAEIKRERDAMKREKKLKPRHKVDLETQAMEAAFAAFDTDGSGTIDLDELRLLTSELGVPMSEKGLREGFADMDADRSGGIAFSEFAVWWKAETVRSQSKTHMALLKMKLRGQALVGHLTGATTKAMASKRVLLRLMDKAKFDARAAYRLTNPPVSYCRVCFLSFPTERAWLVHVRHHFCAGRDVLRLDDLRKHVLELHAQ